MCIRASRLLWERCACVYISSPRCVVSSRRGCCVAARASAAPGSCPGMFTDPDPLRPSWTLSSAISLCPICTPASVNHFLASASTLLTHLQYDPSPGLQGAAPPLLIVLKTECYQHLISPGLPLAVVLTFIQCKIGTKGSSKASRRLHLQIHFPLKVFLKLIYFPKAPQQNVMISLRPTVS